MENEKLRVQISDHGAELSSIYDKAADREAVWIGDPAFWNRHAPVLFPFVGKVNGGFYTHKGVNQKSLPVRFCLHRNPGTLRQNPDHHLERRKHR